VVVVVVVVVWTTVGKKGGGGSRSVAAVLVRGNRQVLDTEPEGRHRTREQESVPVTLVASSSAGTACDKPWEDKQDTVESVCKSPPRLDGGKACESVLPLYHPCSKPLLHQSAQERYVPKQNLQTNCPLPTPSTTCHPFCYTLVLKVGQKPNGWWWWWWWWALEGEGGGAAPAATKGRSWSRSSFNACLAQPQVFCQSL